MTAWKSSSLLRIWANLMGESADFQTVSWSAVAFNPGVRNFLFIVLTQKKSKFAPPWKCITKGEFSMFKMADNKTTLKFSPYFLPLWRSMQCVWHRFYIRQENCAPRAYAQIHRPPRCISREVCTEGDARAHFCMKQNQYGRTWKPSVGNFWKGRWKKRWETRVKTWETVQGSSLDNSNHYLTLM